MTTDDRMSPGTAVQNEPVTAFDRETAITRSADGRFQAEIDGGWRVVLGVNGGYLAAITLRAMQEALGTGERLARSLTIHYCRAAQATELACGSD